MILESEGLSLRMVWKSHNPFGFLINLDKGNFHQTRWVPYILIFLQAISIKGNFNRNFFPSFYKYAALRLLMSSICLCIDSDVVLLFF